MNERQNGFTLVETLAAAALMGMVLIAVLNILSAGLAWWQEGWAGIDAQQNARVALNHMINEIKGAREIETVSDSRTLVISQSSGKKIKYDLKDGNIRRSVKNIGATDFSGYNILAYGVEDLEFGYSVPGNPEASNRVTINLVTKKPQGGEFRIGTSVVLRLKIMNK